MTRRRRCRSRGCCACCGSWPSRMRKRRSRRAARRRRARRGRRSRWVALGEGRGRGTPWVDASHVPQDAEAIASVVDALQDQLPVLSDWQHLVGFLAEAGHAAGAGGKAGGGRRRGGGGAAAAQADEADVSNLLHVIRFAIMRATGSRRVTQARGCGPRTIRCRAWCLIDPVCFFSSFNAIGYEPQDRSQARGGGGARQEGQGGDAEGPQEGKRAGGDTNRFSLPPSLAPP